MKKQELYSIGSTLIVLAITPTPDDATVVSPVLQGIAGLGFLIAGYLSKE